MKVKELEVVVLARDITEHGLLKGDVGTVVMVYPRGGVEVEFVRPTGQTQALLTLTTRDIRKVDESDVFSIRHAVKVGEKRGQYEP